MKDSKDIFSVKDKVIIITGGGGYLGFSYAEALGKKGARIIIWDTLDQALLEEKIAPLKKQRLKISAYTVDITDESSVAAVVKEIHKSYGHIDVLINNAAMNPRASNVDAATQFAPYEDYPIDLWQKELQVNLTGTMVCTKIVAKVMIKQKSGSIINIGSDVTVVAHDHRVYADPQNKKFKSVAYSTSKSALLGFTRQWAARLGEFGVRINVFSPTGASRPSQKKDFVKRYSDTIMMGRMGTPGDYVGPIQFLASDASAFMTGQNLIVDGGRTSW